MSVQIKRDEKKIELEKMRKRDREMVKGMFKFHEVPGGQLSFMYRCYKEDPVERYDLIDGEIYTIPRGVAKHLNRNGWYPVHKYAQDERGKSIQSVGEKIHRFSFQSLEFTDVGENENQDKAIVTVQNL